MRERQDGECLHSVLGVSDSAFDPYDKSNAAYLLGALSAADRAEYEDLLADCHRCSAAVIGCAALPGLLGVLPEAEGKALLDESRRGGAVLLASRTCRATLMNEPRGTTACFPKELSKQLLREGFTTSQIGGVLLDVKSFNFEPSRSNYAAITCTVLVDEGLSELERARLVKALHDAPLRVPLSRYGLEVECVIDTVDVLATRADAPTPCIQTGELGHLPAS
jgi:hypothetical protein